MSQLVKNMTDTSPAIAAGAATEAAATAAAAITIAASNSATQTSAVAAAVASALSARDAASAKTLAESARDVAMMSRGIFATTAKAIGKGVASINTLVSGSAGTNGTFALAFTGGAGTGAAGLFTVSGGAVVAMTITSAGDGYTSAPAVSFAASAGLTAASATAVISENAPLNTFFSVPVSGDPASLILYKVEAGPLATEITRYPSSSGFLNARPISIFDAGKNRVLLPGGGVFAGGGADTTGAVKIKLPIGVPARNVVLDITIMDNYGVMNLQIAGFNNVGVWNYTRATVQSDHTYQPQPSIRWGNDGTGDCVWIGDLAVNYWAYPQIWIESVYLGNGSIDGWAQGWAISLATAFDTVTAGPLLPVKPMSSQNPTFAGTMNGGNVNFPFAAGGTFIGYQSGPVTPISGTYNTTIGYQAGAAMTTGYNNTFGGLQTGAACTAGYANSGWGLQTLQYLTTGSFNAAYSIHALLSLTTGQSNNAFGAGAMEYLTAGNSNNALGMYAGRDTQGSGNLFLGNHAGITANSSEELWISNSATQNLIRGNFAQNRVWIGGGTDDGVNTHQVNGPIRFKPAATSTPESIGDLTFEATSNTSLKIKFRGSDGVVRSATLALA
jgi:hypothetical protein